MNENRYSDLALPSPCSASDHPTTLTPVAHHGRINFFTFSLGLVSIFYVFCYSDLLKKGFKMAWKF